MALVTELMLTTAVGVVGSVSIFECQPMVGDRVHDRSSSWCGRI
jgi:hypothetical protein